MHLPTALARRKRNPFGHWRLVQAFFFGLATIGPVAPGLAEGNGSVARFERLRDEDRRVATVAYRVATANVERCGRAVAAQPGFVLHSIDQYAPADRDEAARAFALGDRVGVMAVVDASPAAKAGLKPGDRLVAINGRAFDRVSADAAPTRASVDHALGMLAAEMARGDVTLRVRAPGDGERDVRFAAEYGCASAVEFAPGGGANAWADGARVMISDGLLLRCASDADLAFVIGHEMAHNLLGHRQRLAAMGVMANSLLPLTDSGSAAMRETEEEADRFAVTLAAGAGYDLSGAAAFIGGLLSRTAPTATTHPAIGRRLALLHAAIAAVQRGAGFRA